MSDQLRDTAEAQAAIVAEAQRIGALAYAEYPGFVRILTLGGAAHVGTANGPWQADTYRAGRDDCDGYEADGQITVPESHAGTAEGIARWIVGALAGLSEYRAYASAAEQRKADRPLKGGRR